MHRLGTVVAAWIVALAASLAHAFGFPPDAEFIVTDAQGVIVAIGRTVGGTSASVAVLSGFGGPARLTLFRRDGGTQATDVAIEAGVVTIGGVDLRVLLAEVFDRVAVRFVAAPGAEPADDVRVVPGHGGEPPGQDRRPDEPPGLDQRPEEPPGQDRRPEKPPGPG